MGKLIVYFVDGSKNILPNAEKELFDGFVEFFKNEKKTNLTLQTNNGCALYLKDKILYILYTEDKEAK